MLRPGNIVRFNKAFTTAERRYFAKEQGKGASSKVGEVSEHVKEHAEEAKEDLRKQSEVLREQVEKKATETTGDQEAVSVDDIYDTTRELKDKVVDSAKSGASKVKDQTENVVQQAGPIKDKVIGAAESLFEKAKQVKDKILDMARSDDRKK